VAAAVCIEYLQLKYNGKIAIQCLESTADSVIVDTDELRDDNFVLPQRRPSSAHSLNHEHVDSHNNKRFRLECDENRSDCDVISKCSKDLTTSSELFESVAGTGDC